MGYRIWAPAVLLTALACTEDPEPPPNPVVLHRLNRLEYDRTVRDLLQTDLRPARSFPPDDPSLGFDNVSDVLSLSPLAFELHHAAARQLADELIGGVPSSRFEGEALDGPDGVAFHGEAWRLTQGELEIPFQPVAAGLHRIEIAAYGEGLAGPAELTVLVGDDAVETFTLSAEMGRYEVSLTIASTTAPSRFALRLVSPHVEGRVSRAAFVDWVRVDGPLDGVARGPGYDAVFTCTPGAQIDQCLDEVLRSFLRRAYRRTPTNVEVATWSDLARAFHAAGDRFDEAIARALVGILVSPKFLFRVEPSGDAAIDDFALASRLSYFLWSSMPDDQLLDLAAAGRLYDELPSQIDRMLADEKSEALVDGFAAQWLALRAFQDATPSSPEFDPELSAAMEEELRLFAGEVLRKDHPVEALLTADFTFVDARLARHYGLPFSGAEMTRIVLPLDSPRRGLLGKGALLTATSHPNRSSPVRRGKWVLDQLLCLPPAPPPADVPRIENDPNEVIGERARLERHRSDPACASCHATIDPIGFALEPFDAIGAFRAEQAGSPIDATGILPDGASFDGPLELSAELASRASLRRCIAEKVFVYALGRGVGEGEAPVIDDITQRYGAAGGRLSDAIRAVATSERFAQRRAGDRR